MRVIAHLALFLFALRALIPVGFMPDLQALASGSVEIVICTPDGLQSVRVDENGDRLPDDGKKDPVASEECPFHAVFAKSFSVPELQRPLPRLRHERVHFVIPPAAEIPAGRSGPPLGQRAPPHA